MKQKIDQNKLLFVIINVIMFTIFLWANVITPLSGDDLDYQYIFWTDKRVENVQDVVTSQIRHWEIWGGRSVVHFIDQFFLMYDKMYFNIANAVVFIVFVLLIYYMAMNKKVSNSFLILEYALLLCAIPHPMETIVWQTSSANYLWGSTLILAFLLPYYHIAHNKKKYENSFVVSAIKVSVAFLGGIVSGWTLEAGGAMLLLTLVMIVGYQVYKRETIYVWEIIGFVGALIGFAFMILAPGNFNRADIVLSEGEQRTLIAELFFRIARETFYMVKNMWILFIAMIILYVKSKKEKSNPNIRMEYMKAALFIIVSLVGVYVMTASPAYAERVLVTPIAFAVVAIGILYNTAVYSLKDKTK